MAMGMSYDFSVHPPDRTFSLAIQGSDADGPMIRTSFVANREALTDGSLLRAFFGTPLMTLKVIAGIHWEALRLWRKGLRVHPHPPAPAHPVSVVAVASSDRLTEIPATETAWKAA
jgi:DUF1365 family protein